MSSTCVASDCQPWPGSIDLVVQTTFPLDAPLYRTLFPSVALHWPGHLGKFLLVVRKADMHALKVAADKEYAAACARAARILRAWGHPHRALVPLHVVGEEIIPAAWSQHPYFAKQLLTLMLDQYSKAEYIALMDSDGILLAPVAANLLFAPSGKPWLIGAVDEETIDEETGGPGLRKWGFINSTRRLLRATAGWQLYNFMVQLPVVVHRPMLRRLRGDMLTIHRATGPDSGAPSISSFLGIFGLPAVTWADMPCNFCLLGNWALRHHPDSSFEFIYESRSAPLLRVAVHGSTNERLVQRPYPVYAGTLNQQRSKVTEGGLRLREQIFRNSICAVPATFAIRTEGCSGDGSAITAMWDDWLVHLLEWQMVNLWGASLVHFDVCRAFAQLFECSFHHAGHSPAPTQDTLVGGNSHSSGEVAEHDGYIKLDLRRHYERYSSYSLLMRLKTGLSQTISERGWNCSCARPVAVL